MAKYAPNPQMRPSDKTKTRVKCPREVFSALIAKCALKVSIYRCFYQETEKPEKSAMTRILHIFVFLATFFVK